MGFVAQKATVGVHPAADVVIKKENRRRVKGRIFNIGYASRIYDNDIALSSDDDQSYVFTIDNIKSKTLHLIQNHTYFFRKKDSLKKNFSFVLTDHPCIGTSYIDNSPHLTYLTDGLLLIAHDSLPSFLYYQDRHIPYMGGIIRIHSKEEYDLRKKAKQKRKSQNIS